MYKINNELNEIKINLLHVQSITRFHSKTQCMLLLRDFNRAE